MNEIISKTVFVETMKSVEENREFQDKLNDVLSVYSEDSLFIDFKLETAIFNLLTEMFKDEDAWLEYCMYDLDMLKDYDRFKDSISDKNGDKIDLSTWGNVYDRLVKNMN